MNKKRIILSGLLAVSIVTVQSANSCTKDSQCTYYYYCCNNQCQYSSCSAGTNTQCVSGDGCQYNLYSTKCCGTSCISPSTTCSLSSGNSTSGSGTGTSGSGTGTSGSGTGTSGSGTGSSGSGTGSSSSGSTSSGSSSSSGSSTKSSKKCKFYCPDSCCNSDGTCQSYEKCLGLCTNDFSCGSDMSECCSEFSLDVNFLVDKALELVFDDYYTKIKKMASTDFYCLDRDFVSTVNTGIQVAIKSFTLGTVSIDFSCKPALRRITIIVCCVGGGLLCIITICCIVCYIRRRKRRQQQVKSATQVVPSQTMAITPQVQVGIPAGHYGQDQHGPNQHYQQVFDSSVKYQNPLNGQEMNQSTVDYSVFHPQQQQQPIGQQLPVYQSQNTKQI